MNKVTTISLVLALMVMSGIGGAVVNNFYIKNQYINHVKIEKTKSGSFYIKDEHIYSVSELQTDTQFAGNMVHAR